MRTTIIPAQITTVEDKIAGSLNMTQILIMMVPILWTALVYLLLFPAMKLVPYKLALIILVTISCLTLAFRIKDKIVAEWLGVLIRFRIRPKYYLFNKNDLVGRTLDIPELPTELAHIKRRVKKFVKNENEEIDITSLVKLEHIIKSGKVALTYQFSKKSI